MGRFLCMIGVHRWRRKPNPESGKRTYYECERCHKARTIIRSGIGGGDGGGSGGGDGGWGDGGNGGNGG